MAPCPRTQRSFVARFTRAIALSYALQCILASTPQAQTRDITLSPRAQSENKLDELAQKLDQLDKSTLTRFEILEAKRAVEQRAFDEKIGLVKEITDVRKDVVGNAQKSIDWWLATLAILMAVFGIAVPLVLTRDLKNKHNAQLKEIELDRERIRNELALGVAQREEIDDIRSRANEALSAIERNRDQSSEHVAALVAKINSTGQINDSTGQINEPLTSAERTEKIRAALEVAGSKDASLADRLFAKGVVAFESDDYETAQTMFAAATTENSQDHRAFNNLGVTFARLADATEGAERHRLRLQAINKYESALKLKSDDHNALNNWGVALGRLAELAEGDERRRLRSDEIGKYEAALRIKPDYVNALSNYGAALAEVASTANGDERHNLLLDAVKKFDAALGLNPNNTSALNNLGAVLVELAGTVEGERRTQLLRQALTKYEASLKIRPSTALTFHNWGLALDKLADELDSHERAEYYLAAASKYESAIKLDPNFHETLNALAAVFLRLANITPDPSLKALYIGQAEAKSAEYEQRTGKTTYNLACVAARKNDAKRFVDVMDRIVEENAPDEVHLRNDPDLDSIRNSPEFGEWWRKRFGNEP